MGSIGNYIFRTTIGAFLVVLISLTAVIWVTQALRDFDLMTNQGQTVLVFIGITGLIIPLLVLVIAPLALVVAVAHVLNKLSTDSEIIVMNAAGMSPWRLFRPFLAAAAVVSILVSAISVYFAPEGLRLLRVWLTEVRTDLVTNIVQPGRFVSIERGLTFHIRDRQPNGQLIDVLLDDQRNDKERITLVAEHGQIEKNEHGSFLVFENGSAATPGSRPARSRNRVVQLQPVRSVAVLRQPPSHQLFRARTLSVGADCRPIPTTRCTKRSPANSAPNFTIAFSLRSIRLLSS